MKGTKSCCNRTYNEILIMTRQGKNDDRYILKIKSMMLN